MFLNHMANGIPGSLRSNVGSLLFCC